MSSDVAKIELVLPFKAEYVSVARLAVSGISSRLGFDIEAIEDIKVALSEVCNKLVTRGSMSAECYRIVFSVRQERLDIAFDSEDKSLCSIFRRENDELGISIIEALMDSLEISADGSYILSMSKFVEEKRDDADRQK
jgi:serine/threonine-protein kinase RsbW